MTFNKWYPDRVDPPLRSLTGTQRAWVLRGAWYMSTAMLVAGYVLLFVVWSR